MGTLVVIVVIMIILSSVLGKKEKREELKKEKQIELNNIINSLNNTLHIIEKTYYDEKYKVFYYFEDYNGSEVKLPWKSYEEVYSEIWQYRNRLSEFGKEYSLLFDKKINEHIISLNKEIEKGFTNIINDADFIDSICKYLSEDFRNKIMLLKYVNSIDCRYDGVINVCNYFSKKEIREKSRFPFFLKELSYGNFAFSFDEQTKIENYNSQSVKQYLDEVLLKIKDNSDEHYCGVIDAFNSKQEWQNKVASYLWYQAVKSPFDADDFENAYKLYFKFICYNGYGDDYPTVEMLLARVYSKKKMGGLELVRQEWRELEIWAKSSSNPKYVEILASGLAWMEFYEMERDILRLMVECKMTLSPVVQERLRFLENTNSLDVEVYDIVPSSEFKYDSSSESWGNNEMDVFFRKVGMKKITLNYSLQISCWKKTLPLSAKTKFNQGYLDSKFEDMVKDFDGEVTCRKSSAKAVNLENIEYKNATIFEFTSERNRCITMIFHCEKFGRNLNIIILTLFTPEEGLTLEEMEKYALAIKSNVYVNSFKESILQTVDDVLKEEVTIFDDDSSSSENNTMFE